MDPAAADGTGQLTCAIADRGEGVAAEEIDSLFQAFGRTASGHRLNPKGAGLGLSFVATVVARHRGTLSCESRPGEGATFEIEVPLSAPALRVARSAGSLAP